MNLGLIGWPLEHSLSAKYFAKKFKSSKIAGVYNLFPMRDLDQIISLIDNYRLDGLNVTIPHKSNILNYLDYISPDALEIGAVNTVKIIRDINNNPILKGFNTDYLGFSESLTPLLTPESKIALVLGYGGAAKAVVYALLKLGIDVKIVSRNPVLHINDNLIDTHKIKCLAYSDLTQNIVSDTQLIVNTTPLGMWPNIDSCPDIPWNYIKKGTVCYDLIYNPEQTLFLKKAQMRDAVIKNGYEMLIRQADHAWNIWTNPLI